MLNTAINRTSCLHRSSPCESLVFPLPNSGNPGISGEIFGIASSGGDGVEENLWKPPEVAGFTVLTEDPEDDC